LYQQYDRNYFSLRLFYINKRKEAMKKILFLTVFILIGSLSFFSCPTDDDTKIPNPSESTWIEFKNLEKYPVTMYNDSLRQTVFTEVTAEGTKKVPAEANLNGKAFYPTFHIAPAELLGNSIPCNAPSLLTVIEANITNKVNIPALDSIEFNSSYITITNNDVSPLTFCQGNNEKPPIDGSSTIILSGKNAAYEITPGDAFGYSIKKNTTTSIAFPAGLSEFKKGVIYIFTYNGTDLTLKERSIQQIVFPPPESLRIASVTENSVSLAWDTVSKASGYNIYRSSAENGTYDKVNTGIITGTEFTDTGLEAYTAYYYKLSAIYKNEFEEIQVSPVSVSTGLIVSGTSLAEKLDWLKNNAVSNFLYIIEADSNESLVKQTLSYSGKSGITIVLKGGEAMRTITLSSSGSLFTITGVTLILDNNITLNGRNGNDSSLISISKGGTMIMNDGSKITGNTYASNDVSAGGGVRVEGNFIMNGGEISNNKATSTSEYDSGGGGVYVNGTGTFTMNGGKISGNSSYVGGGVAVDSSIFTMNGGEISGNTASIGGGVYVGGMMNTTYSSFRMSGGVIYGNNASTSLRNTATISGASVYIYEKNMGTVQYGTFSGNNFHKSGDLDTSNTTIRIVNGNLQNN
jgi:hypothetical protein